MKFKQLLFLLTLFGVSISMQAKQLAANDTIKGLIFTETVMSSGYSGQWEITNMTTESINLSSIEFGLMTPWSDPGDTWHPRDGHWMMLPDYDLGAGESYVIALCYDATPELYKLNLKRYGVEKFTRDSIWSVTDLQIHIKEVQDGDEQLAIDNGIRDSISTAGTFLTSIWSGGACVYLRQHFPASEGVEADSVVIDQFGGVFDSDEGKNYPHPYDVAGVTDATANSKMIRKFSVKEGNLDFASARGVGEDDSEWIVVPYNSESRDREIFWTLGNHGNYTLDATTLESDVMQIDFPNKTITVPWGIRRMDDVMNHMTKKPGLAWKYILSGNYEDSLSLAAHTGDKIEIYACGDVKQTETFDIIVSEPTTDANIVVPAISPDPNGYWREVFENGAFSWPRVTRDVTGNDTIWGQKGGIPYATRVDSLLKRLEKPTKASWEMIWVDGVEKRADVKNGDILRVTSESGAVKNYFIKVGNPLPSRTASLNAITWPDISEDNSIIYGWKGDTIPDFGTAIYNYRVTVPFDYYGIPALVGTLTDKNSKLTVTRAKYLIGTREERTVTFTVTAEDNETVHIYRVEFVKEPDLSIDPQPYHAEPFFSEIVISEQWANTFIEVVNPGNQPLDLSDYIFMTGWEVTNPADVITAGANSDRWMTRYYKYIPGYKWADTQSEWDINPYIAQPENNVSPILEPGKAFVVGGIGGFGEIWHQNNADFYKETILDNLNVSFRKVESDPDRGLTGLAVDNPWGEEYGDASVAGGMSNKGNYFLFKILNDSVKQGLKAAIDPADFLLLDNIGMDDGGQLVFGGVPVTNNKDCRRKPEITKGNPNFSSTENDLGSMGLTPESSEWIMTDADYYANLGYGYPDRMTMLGSDFGEHYAYPATTYISTIQSNFYKVSEGYSDGSKEDPETIDGVVTGTTVTECLANIIKLDENQTLTFKAATDGVVLTDTDILNDNDTLIVVSADESNTTKYLLSVTADGLSSDAVLTSTVYTIDITDDTGTITGVDYDLKVSDVVDNIMLPNGALLQIINGDGEYVALKKVNNDTVYVDVTVTDDIYFEVTAEDNRTKITYQLTPTVSADDAFIVSSVYGIDQDGLLIKYCIRGTNVASFFSNITVVQGATAKLVDKFGLDRIDGVVADDDKLIVTSASGNVKKVYHIAMSVTQYIPEGAYLAYIMSDTYQIDQIYYDIDNVPDGETVSDFLSKVTPAAGATIIILDSDGIEKTTGTIVKSDIIKVTSSSGNNYVIYTIDAVTGVGSMKSYNVSLYPNPTTGILNVQGLDAGNRIRIYNISGTLISDTFVSGSVNTISLEGAPNGIYLIQITDGKTLVGHFKVLKK